MWPRTKGHTNAKAAGFGLVELLVVVVVIGILASIAIPLFLNQRRSAVDAAVESDMRNLASTIEAYAARTGGTYPTANNNATTGIRYAAGTRTITVGPNLTQRVSTTGTRILYQRNGTIGFYLCAYNSTSGRTSATSAFVYSSAGGGVRGARAACNASNPVAGMYTIL